MGNNSSSPLEFDPDDHRSHFLERLLFSHVAAQMETGQQPDTKGDSQG